MKILLIEDEEELRNTVREYLTREKFIVECAEDYASAMEKVNDYDYDCVLLDIMLPGGSGLSIWPTLNGRANRKVSSSSRPKTPLRTRWKGLTSVPTIIWPNHSIWLNLMHG